MQRMGKEAAERALQLTKEILLRRGPRITGTKECLDAAADIADELKEHCDAVSEEPFAIYPGAMWHTGKAAAIAYVLSIVLLGIGGICVYFVPPVCILALVYGVAYYVRCVRWFDRLFGRKPACNVAGTIEPIQPAKQQIIIAGHHDSPYVFTFLAHLQKLAGVRLGGAVAFYLYITVLGIFATVQQIASSQYWALPLVHLIISIAGLLFVGQLFFLVTRKKSPGAGDNLIACAMACTLAEHYAKERPQHTRLIFLSTDGEEAGQRGAIEYAEKHLQELKALPTYVFNIDSIYTTAHLGCITRDRHGTQPLSMKMADAVCGAAAELGYSMKKVALGLGGGGTDAAAFAKAGIEAINIIAMSTSVFDEGRVYHTLNDTVERIEPGAVEAVMETFVNYVWKKDEETGLVES